jgi:hypothetical protein
MNLTDVRKLFLINEENCSAVKPLTLLCLKSIATEFRHST